VSTLGVDDLERAPKFYRDGLGFPTQRTIGTEFEHGAVAFFDLQHSVKLVILARMEFGKRSVENSLPARG